MSEINDLIYKLENPQIYTGKEINSIRKDIWGSGGMERFIHVCLVFPDKYEIGMSHFGLTLLYHLLNSMPNVNAERCFLPGKPSIEVFKQSGVPLFSLENKIPLRDFDIIGFTVMSEMNHTNILQVLELAEIPFKSSDRNGGNCRFPLIVAGGISAINPEPIRDFIDVFAFGDGEALFPDLIHVVSDGKEKQFDRSEVLKCLDGIDGCYVPQLYPAVLKGRFYGPDMERGRIKKRFLRSLEGVLPGPEVITPITNVVFNRMNVEIARGCPQSCRFCQAKSYYAPYRPRPLDENIHYISDGLRETGFDTFSLSTLSTGDYPKLNELLQLIPDILAVRPGVNFSISSLRPSTLSDHLLSTVALFKRTGLTIVPEAGTQRLRNVINKNVSDEEIFGAVDLALKNRWQKIKLYFMLGLPTESMEDVVGIAGLIKRIVEMSRGAKQRVKINASFSPFVPKPHTPLQWAGASSREHVYGCIQYLKTELRTLSKQGYVELDFHSVNTALVETIIARGDYRVGDLLMEAFKRGEIFSSWDSEFHYGVWDELLADGKYNLFLEELSTEESLPWDFLSVNFDKEYLSEEYKKALAAERTSSCSDMDCGECRGCSFKMNRSPFKDGVSLFDSLKKEIEVMKEAIPDGVLFKKIRIGYEKTGDFTLFSHLAMMQYIERLIRRTGIYFKITEGFTPRIKMQPLPPLPVFATGLDEVAELFVEASLGEAEILERLNLSGAPMGFRFKWVRVCNESKSLSKDIHFIGYEIKVENPEEMVSKIREHLVETDSVSVSGDGLILTVDYSKQGQERFSKIYKIIDPERNRTMNLTRSFVSFLGLKKEAVLVDED